MPSATNSFFPLARALRFFFLDVLPTAGGQIYYWVREWQILLVGVFALFLAWRWSQNVERRAARIAKEVLNRMVGLQSTSKSEEIDPNGDPSSRAEPLVETIPVQSRSLPPDNGSQGPADDIDALMRDLKSFRRGVRSVLAVTPVSDDYLPENIAREYQKLAGLSFLRFETSPGLEREIARLLTKLDEGISSMKTADSATCRELWDRLIEINAIARATEEAVLSCGSNASVQVHD